VERAWSRIAAHAIMNAINHVEQRMIALCSACGHWPASPQPHSMQIGLDAKRELVLLQQEECVLAHNQSECVLSPKQRTVFETLKSCFVKTKLGK